jgi:hypothetical protein
MQTYDWERNSVAQLYREYRLVCSQHQIALRPVVIQLFDSKSHWGLWDPVTRTISISRRLVLEHSWFYVQAILKHEMAHQVVHDMYGVEASNLPPHGEWFQLACQRLGVLSEFARASVRLQETPIDWRNEKRDEASSKLLDKVQKLLALATSSNEHEALLAMEKVRELYAKYNLEKSESNQKQSFAHISIQTGKKRFEAHQERILSILVGHFFVEVITSKLFDAKTGDYFKMIELIGTRENTLMAEYVYHFLLQQSDFWLRETAKSSHQKISRIDRKSLKLGILEGFSEKLAAAEKGEAAVPQKRSSHLKPSDSSTPQLSSHSQNTWVSTALMRFKNDPALKSYISTVYPRIQYRTGPSQSVDPSFYETGRSIGKTITLNQAIAAQSQNRGRLLSG